MSNTRLIDDLKDLIDQFETQKIDKKQVIATMKNIVNYETKKLETINFMKYEYKGEPNQ